MRMQSKLEAGKFVVLAEAQPPKGVDVSRMVSSASRVKGAVDAFVVPEMSNAVMRMSSLGGAMILQAKGMDAVLQVCCRDRNRIALQADLLAAYACGISTVMAVTGEDPSFGDHHQAKAVYDLQVLELLRGIQSLQSGRDMAGIELAGTPTFLVGSTVNAGVEGAALDSELREMDQRIEAGVRFFVIPPLFDVSSIEPFLKRVDHRQLNIIPTVVLLKSAGMARYMNQHLSHIHIPGALIDRIQEAPDRVTECIRIAGETVAAVKREGFKGVLLSTMGWEDRLSDILERNWG